MNKTQIKKIENAKIWYKESDKKDTVKEQKKGTQKLINKLITKIGGNRSD